MSKDIAYKVTVEEATAVVEDYVVLPENKEVAGKLVNYFVEELPEIIKGNRNTDDVMTDILELHGTDLAKLIVLDKVVDVEDSDYNDIKLEADEDGALFFGATVEDLNVDDIFNNICLESDSEGTSKCFEVLENMLKGSSSNSLELDVYKNSNTEELLLTLH